MPAHVVGPQHPRRRDRDGTTRAAAPAPRSGACRTGRGCGRRPRRSRQGRVQPQRVVSVDSRAQIDLQVSALQRQGDVHARPVGGRQLVRAVGPRKHRVAGGAQPPDPSGAGLCARAVVDDGDRAVHPVRHVQGTHRKRQLPDALGEETRDELSCGPEQRAPFGPDIQVPPRGVLVEVPHRLQQPRDVGARPVECLHGRNQAGVRPAAHHRPRRSARPIRRSMPGRRCGWSGWWGRRARGVPRPGRRVVRRSATTGGSGDPGTTSRGDPSDVGPPLVDRDGGEAARGEAGERGVEFADRVGGDGDPDVGAIRPLHTVHDEGGP